MNAHTLYTTGRRQRAEQTCKHSTKSLILFPALADQDEPVRRKHIHTYLYTIDPSSAQDPPSCSWLHSLEPELLSSVAGTKIRKSSRPAALLQWWGMQTCTHTHPGALQELALGIGSTQQLAPGFPGLPVSSHTDANSSLSPVLQTQE